MNDERVTGAVGTGEVIAKFGRHVLGFIRMGKLFCALHGELEMKDRLCHTGVRFNSQAFTRRIGRVEQASKRSFRQNAVNIPRAEGQMDRRLYHLAIQGAGK